MVRVRYCDEYTGTTAALWLEEFADIMASEYGVRPVVTLSRDCSVEYDPVVEVAGEKAAEGLPSDPGHLYELVKRVLDKVKGC